MTRQATIHIGLNAHLLSQQAGYRKGGIHNYIQQLIDHLADADPSLYATIFTGQAGVAQREAKRFSWQVSRWSTERPWLRVAWEQFVQPRALRRAGVQLLHSLAFVLPLASSVPAVMTVHDLSFLRFPERFRPANRLYLSTMTRLSCQRARRVIAVSQATADEIVDLLGVSPECIDVIPHGVEHDRFHPFPSNQVSAFRREKNLPERSILFLGTLEPRKNLVTLIEAYARTSAIREGVPLIIAGGRGWHYQETFQRVEELNLTGSVCFPGFVPADELPMWYNAATIFVYPSLYEGFGMPLLEAMACGTPVIGSNASCIPEVVGDVGPLIAPEDVEGFANSIDHLLADDGLRAELSRRGQGRASTYTWRATTMATIKSYRHALNLDVPTAQA